MPTARSVCETALRKLGILASGRAARPSDLADTLEALQGLYTSWIIGGAFGRLCDVVPTGSSYIARGNERIIRTDTLEVTLPDLVADDAYGDCQYYGTTITIDTTDDVTTVQVSPSQPMASYAQPPRDGAVVVITDRVGGETRSYLYDGTIKQWQGIESLDEDDEAPRSTADPLGLASCLAMEIADQFNGEINPATQMQAARFKAALTQRFGMRREETAGCYF